MNLDSSVQYIKGIGPKRAFLLKKIDVNQVKDLVFLVPRRYVDYTKIVKIGELRINDEATVTGTIRTVEKHRTRTSGSIIRLLLDDGSGTIGIKWFNRPDLNKKFNAGQQLLISGKVTFYHGRQFVNPLYEILTNNDQQGQSHFNIIPIYPLTEGLGIWEIRRAVRRALEDCDQEIQETIPDSILVRHRLPALKAALWNVHFPESLDQAELARQRLVFDEFFYFELVLAIRRSQSQKNDGISMREKGTLTKEYLRYLPFQLTHGQLRAIEDIVADMAKPSPMNRLLQGDVGSGKTVIAIYAMLVALENRYQAALMAPTEILAEQHYLVISELLGRLGIAPVLLTSSIPASERNININNIAQGKVNFVIGTHALIEERIMFKNLGLAVVDEQHRFGVMQRAAIVNKGINPDFLVMSATPIPRTLALTLYGDLDITTLREKPPCRTKVYTKIVKTGERNDILGFIRQELKKGRQAFVICPVIEKTEKMMLKSVNEAYKEIADHFPEFSIDLVHGRVASDKKADIMNRFRKGDINILVATTVIEVGVDIPNATMMLIEHPERFGLAQLHQLRGRIGRGSERSYCFLFLDRFIASETYERISYFEKTDDGFMLAQKDMKLRGPGEILGKKQHGLPDIKIGDLELDQKLLFMARDDAFQIITNDPDLNFVENKIVKEQLQKMKEIAELLRIG
ncbi:ATP-dependent DNA helicase RecG [candidate division WOR-3 bacterium RBG_13_43_14]|uniref:ATP-dependent DNA helicase RecG n=1 Tax=candidate division WOR-3 bacterium RBG_13_43_14 TaxID=1802590 RepID=A0A1F4U3E4_UNCW3|nr:MAG: ATP-dependent DNA helicase RecG [candidate division WOR-3 bacterium RBG_13_43_14]